MARRVVLIVMAAVVALASPAGAGGVGRVIEAATGGALAIEVSRAYFPSGSAPGAVVTDLDDPGAAAVAAAFAGVGAGRAPLLFTGQGVSDAAVRAEIARATGGSDAPGKPTVWLAGATLSGLEGYDVRSMGDSAAEVARTVIDSGAAAGTAGRVLLFAGDDWRAGAVAAGFGATYGIPVLPAGAVPADLGTPKPVAIVIGSAPVTAAPFSRVDRIEGAGAAALSVAAADALVAKEFPAGAPLTVPVPLRPVAADGYGTNPIPAFLAAVAAAALQGEGNRPPVLLVDARPTGDLAAGCAAGGRDAPALCLMAKADGSTTVLALTAARSDAAAGTGLPATGGPAFPLSVVVLAVAVLIVRRRTRATLASEQWKGAS